MSEQELVRRLLEDEIAGKTYWRNCYRMGSIARFDRAVLACKAIDRLIYLCGWQGMFA